MAGRNCDGLLYVKVEPRTGGIASERCADFFEQAVARLARTPGVVSATATDSAPLEQSATIFTDMSFPICTPGYVAADVQSASVSFNSIAPRFFETMQSPIVAGREFEWRDRTGPDYGPGTPLVAIVNEAFARQFFAGRNPLDQRFGVSCPQKPTQINVAVPTFGETTPIELREERMQQERLLTDLLLAFGAVALVLSSIGMYGMLVYMVTRRTAEIGIRMALGARRLDVVWMVLRESIGPVAAGLAAGGAGALIAAHWIDHLLFGISAHDPLTMVGAAIVFLFIAAGAAILPARRAARINPLGALRSE